MVQRARRKQHLASRPGDSGPWVTVCDRDVQDDAVVTALEDAQATVDAHADQVCAHCQRLLLMAAAVASIAHLLPRVVPAPAAAPVPERLAPVIPIRRTA